MSFAVSSASQTGNLVVRVFTPEEALVWASKLKRHHSDDVTNHSRDANEVFRARLQGRAPGASGACQQRRPANNPKRSHRSYLSSALDRTEHGKEGSANEQLNRCRACHIASTH
jgi:hypothetical protein